MHLDQIYNFCPVCGGKLDKSSEDYLLCTKCQKKLYLNPLPCNAVILENDKGEILLVKRAQDPKKGFWDLPGGFIQPQEDYETSLRREVKEELRCDISEIQILGAYDDQYLYQGIDYPTLGIVAKARLRSNDIHTADDVNEYQFFREDEIPFKNIAFESVVYALRQYLKNRPDSNNRQ